MSTNDPTGVESTGTTTAESSNTDSDQWVGPFTEPSPYGGTTGYTYLRCRECGIEVLTDSRTHATHRAGCPQQ
ncbi:hypothetical protein DJ74_00325 [Halorubrum sp. Ea8]|nr:hypothetical protein DJ74_00325 [Halorubrum sp. Ea8]